MIANGSLSQREAAHLEALFDMHEADRNAFHVTPGVLHIIARKPL
jgi:hypothetical protein